MSMEYAEVRFFSKALIEEEETSFNNLLSASAFVSWLTTDTKKRRFLDYLKFLGLVEKEKPLTDYEKEKLIARSNDLAARILKADKQRKV